jgi:putative MFS transporter
LPAVILVPVADRVGRRRVFLASLGGVSLATFFTAFSQTPVQFVMLQMVARACMISCGAMSLVIITEEFPAEHRGWGIGMLGALGACGNGFAAMLFAFVQMLPFGWRALYAFGLLPMALLPLLRREIKETGRFTRHRDAHRADPSQGWVQAWAQPMKKFLVTYPGRAATVAAAAGLGAIGSIAAFQFTAYYAFTVHHWAPAQFSLMVIIGGGIGIIGNIAAGRLGDRIGRRWVGLGFLSAFPLFVWIFYNGPGWSLPLAWIGLVFCATAGQVIVRALATEIFPTSQRGTAAGWLSLVDTLGAAVGLGLIGLASETPADIAHATSRLALVVMLAGATLLLLPETRRRELESISVEV